MAKRIDQYAVFFAEIDSRTIRKEEVSQSWLFGIFGAEQLRRYFLPLSFLIQDLRIEWNEDTYENLIEQKRVEAVISRVQQEPWSDSLRDYFHHLTSLSKKPLSAKSVRVYMAAAVGLLLHSGVKAISGLTSQHIASFLEDSPGNAASIRSFLRFAGLSDSFEPSLNKKSNAAKVKSEKQQMREFKRSAHKLQASESPSKRRAMLANVISQAYQVPLKRVLRLCKSDLKLDGANVVLWPATLAIVLHKDLAKDLLALSSRSTTDLVFVGRNGIQSLTTTAVNYHVNAAS